MMTADTDTLHTHPPAAILHAQIAAVAAHLDGFRTPPIRHGVVELHGPGGLRFRGYHKNRSRGLSLVLRALCPPTLHVPERFPDPLTLPVYTVSALRSPAYIAGDIRARLLAPTREALDDLLGRIHTFADEERRAAAVADAVAAGLRGHAHYQPGEHRERGSWAVDSATPRVDTTATITPGRAHIRFDIDVDSALAGELAVLLRNFTNAYRT